jgi:hypothetical protein
VAPLAAIRRVIDTLPAYETTDNEQACDLILYLFRPYPPFPPAGDPGHVSTRRWEPPPSNQNAAAQIWILDQNGRLFQENLRHAYTAEGLKALARNLRRLARVKDFMQVATPEQPSPVEITVTPMIPVTLTGETNPASIPNEWPSQVCPAERYTILDPLPLRDFLSKRWDLCTMIRFNARNPSSRTYYFYVVSIGEQAEIEPVYPHIEDSSQLAEIKPGSENVMGKALVRLDTRTVDRYKMIVCKKPINHHLFSQSGFKNASRGTAGKSHPNPLEKIILNALTGTRASVAYEPGSWYAETISIDMRK